MIFTDAEAADLKVWVIKKLEDMYVHQTRKASTTPARQEN